MRTRPRLRPLLATMALALLLPGCAGPAGQGADDGTWVRFDPKQCGGNPWDPPGGQVTGDQEEAAIRAHYGHHGVAFRELERREVAGAVPAVCGAARGYRWFALVSEADSEALIAEGWLPGPGPDEDEDAQAQERDAQQDGDQGAPPTTGGERAGQWYSIKPVQCGGNPWDAQQAQGEDELAHVAAFYAAEGVSVETVEQRLEDEVVCMSCSCPRGDRLYLLAGPGGDDAALTADGWATFEAPPAA